MKKTFILFAAAMAMWSCKEDEGCSSKTVSVPTAQAAQNALDNGATSVTITEPLTADATFSIPAAAAPGEVLTLSIPAGGHNVTVSQPDGVQGFQTIDLAVEDAEDLTIYAPNSSVMFAGDAGNLLSTTASTTLTIEAGSTVDELTVNKGSVIIYGSVGAAIKGTGMPATDKVVQKLGGTLGTATGFSAGQVGRTQGFLPTDAWTKDRYQPANWESVSYQGRTNVFKITVDATTNPANRPANYQTEHRNTQGKYIDVSNSSKSVLWETSVDVYVGSDMVSTATPFRAELWMDVIDPSTDQVNAYPILGVANVGQYNQFNTSARPAKWRTFGYTNSTSTEYTWGTDLAAVTAGWHTIGIRSTGTDIDYYVDDAYVGTVSRTDPLTSYVSAARRVMLQVYNYNSVSGIVTDSVDLPNYSFSGYFSNLGVTIYQ